MEQNRRGRPSTAPVRSPSAEHNPRSSRLRGVARATPAAAKYATVLSKRSAGQAATIRAMLIALEAKDSLTAQHSLHVQSFAEDIGHRLGIRGASLEALAISAALHDVGKIAVPDAILKKPSALTREEYAVMKRHPAVGATMIERCALRNESSILVRHHHEWYDGRGYPSGLRGEEIPFRARIVQVADCIDAMISPRSYRAPLSLEDVVRELRHGSGRQFDPLVATAAIQWLRHEAADLLRTQPRV